MQYPALIGADLFDRSPNHVDIEVTEHSLITTLEMRRKHLDCLLVEGTRPVALAKHIEAMISGDHPQPTKRDIKRLVALARTQCLQEYFLHRVLGVAIVTKIGPTDPLHIESVFAKRHVETIVAIFYNHAGRTARRTCGEMVERADFRCFAVIVSSHRSHQRNRAFRWSLALAPAEETATVLS